MDGRTGLVVLCVGAGGVWTLLAGSLLVGRLRARREAASTPAPAGEWRLPPSALERVGLGDGESDEARTILLRALRSAEPDVRTASITALGRLGERHEWAIDGLVEALVHGADDVVKVATQLDRLAPRAGSRLVPLLGHTSGVVRFYTVRLLARYGSLAGRHIPALTADPSPNVRAAALETLRAAASGEALRCAFGLLGDPNPLVRAHASRTASAIAPQTAASFLVPLLGDRSWWVREAAREGLVAAGRDVTGALAPALESDDHALRSGAALVLQDVGLVDELVRDEDLDQLERILDAGGRRLRTAAADRARKGLSLVHSPALGAEAAS
jgi:HEAT repeat protein